MDSLNALSPSLVSHRAEWTQPSLEQAAREFESLLVAQLLKSAREAGKPLAEESEMTGAENYLELAEKFVAQTLAERGTFGFARLMIREIGPE